jgi:hypothetical protein
MSMSKTIAYMRTFSGNSGWGGKTENSSGLSCVNVVAMCILPCLYSRLRLESTCAADNPDNMSLKSGLNNVGFLERPGGECERPDHQESFGGRGLWQAVARSLLLQRRPSGDRTVDSADRGHGIPSTVAFRQNLIVHGKPKQGEWNSIRTQPQVP